MVAFPSSPVLSGKNPRWWPDGLRVRSPRYRYFFLSLLAIVLLLQAHRLNRNGWASTSAFLKTVQNPVNNGTLGFEKIWVISLKGREDRLLPLLDAANATNLTVTPFEGARDAEIPDVELPGGWDRAGHGTGVLGCFTSHARTWKTIVDENIGSALILESDSDWDMRIQDSIQGLPAGVRTIADPAGTDVVKESDSLTDIYGSDWDVIWMGHCGANSPENPRQYSYEDEATMPDKTVFKLLDSFNSDLHAAGLRSVFPLRIACCLYGYAVSRKGAQKLLDAAAKTNSPIDWVVSNACTERTGGLNCIGVWPPLIAGADSRSNMQVGDNNPEDWENHKKAAKADGPIRNPGHGLQVSARVNAPMILEKNHQVSPADWKYQYEGHWFKAANGTRYHAVKEEIVPETLAQTSS